MTNESIKELLVEELGYKKTFNNSMYVFPCSCCKNTVEQGDEFIFMGDKKKVCINCQAEIIEYLENL